MEEYDYTSEFIIPKDKNTACFDADKINKTWEIRKWKPGDVFIPFGMTGKKHVSDYLTDKKFSLSEKEKQWILCFGEQIAWLIGERTDNRFKVNENTKRVIKSESFPNIQILLRNNLKIRSINLRVQIVNSL